MRTLIVGVGALGGLVAARLLGAGLPVWLATRSRESAASLKASGLRVTGVGGAVSVQPASVAPVDDYSARDPFDLIVLATKAHEAIAVAPRLSALVGPGGTLVPIQNGGVSQVLADQLGNRLVLGGLSNLGATMTMPGVYEQRNAGHLLIGELAGGVTGRAERVGRWLGRAMGVTVTPNIRGAVWSKLVLNCSVTTLGAIAGQTMREYIASPDGRELFDRTYDEALSVALATGARPERILVDPVPPARGDRGVSSATYDGWLGQILDGYGDLKASMLQDFERGRATEIDFINGYVVSLGRQLGVGTPTNEAIVETVHAIARGQIAPAPALLGQILRASY
jgi:2-dehydropantoate 2-reductase